MYFETFAAARALDRMLALLYRQAESRMAVFTLAVAADLAVAEFVAQISKKVFYLIPYSEEFSVLLAALVYVL